MFDGSYGSLGLDSIALLNFEWEGEGEGLAGNTCGAIQVFEYANRIR